jgi:hypothetical protein
MCKKKKKWRIEFMATLASAAKSSDYASRPQYPSEVKKPPVNWLQRLGGYKLVYWRLGNDLFALREQLEKTKAKLGQLDPFEDKQKCDDLLVYQVNLETRQEELVRRKRKIFRKMNFCAEFRLTDQEYQWWRFMEPYYKERPIPEHLQYWLGTTEKNSVNYVRITGGKKHKNGQLLWGIDESGLPQEVTYPPEAIGKEYAFGNGTDVNDVMMDYWWGGIIPHFKKEG